MANYDQFAAAVKEISGGKNIVLLDDLGIPSIYVPVNKLKNSELVSGLSENIHPAFSVAVNGAQVEKDCFYYSKYQNVIINGRAYSLAHRDPKVYVDFDQAREACEAKGAGFHLGTMAEWAAIALLTRKNGTMPHGNNDNGRDVGATHEKGQVSFQYTNSGKKRDGRTFTGSGPATWGHDHTIFGIQDLNGNVWEWAGGMRLKEGEIQIIPYNNAALGAECDQSLSSTLWKAIKRDGSIVEPGTTATLKYDFDSSSSPIIELAISISTAVDVKQYCEYKNISLDTGSTAPELAKVLLVYPDTSAGDYAGDGHWMNNSGERLPVCGGSWSDGSNAGVFGVHLANPRSYSGSEIGFRSAYVEL